VLPAVTQDDKPRLLHGAEASMTAITIGTATARDIDVVEALLEREHLPLDGLRRADTVLVARAGNRIVGSAAVELYQEGALLRSVAVDAEHRGSGIGGALTRMAIDIAKRRGVPAMYLLTTTAERFFPRFGFKIVDRADVPAGVTASEEFVHACPSTAIVMRKFLTPTT
jgi:amino-acid N-acetyltransferase